MPQFLIGFWCGCASAALVACLVYASKKRQLEEREEEKTESGEENGEIADDVKDAFSGLRVLLVDDSRLSRSVIKELLAKKKWKIFEAGSGAECLKMAKKDKYDLIFMNQNMPGMDGNETLQRLWIDGSIDSGVSVIAVGSNIRKENEKEFCEKGYAACLGKPIQENRLEEILAKILSEERKDKTPEGFSYQKGLEFFDGNESAYRETLVLFADLWKERREQLRQFLEEENMAEYAILIHAVKGDARTLGAEVFGELAYAQELSAKAGDIQAIRNGFDLVLETGDKTAEYFRDTFS